MDYEAQAKIFKNRLEKRYRLLKKWARKNGITCYRLYEKDIPGISVSIDVYDFLPKNIISREKANDFLLKQGDKISKNIITEDIEKDIASRKYVVIYDYEKSRDFGDEDSFQKANMIGTIADIVAKTLGVENEHIIVKKRMHAKGGSQYANSLMPKTKIVDQESGKFSENIVLCNEKRESQTSPSCLSRLQSGGSADRESVGKCNPTHESIIQGIVVENSLLFNIDLSSHIDTGLFFDMRNVRKMILENAKDKRVLNLYCYTGSFSVYAASGGASIVDSVDLSKRYLLWAKKNMQTNGLVIDKSTRNESTKSELFKNEKYRFIRSDVIDFLREADARKFQYDIIILDPPTFSNSKTTDNMLDINRDWLELVASCLAILSDNGTLYFSTNSRRLKFSSEQVILKFTSKNLPEGKKLSSDNSSKNNNASKNPQKKNSLNEKSRDKYILNIEDITEKTMPLDFEKSKAHRIWKIKKVKCDNGT